MNQKEWFDRCIEGGTSGDMIFDILADWKEENEQHKREYISEVDQEIIDWIWQENWKDELRHIHQLRWEFGSVKIICSDDDCNFELSFNKIFDIVKQYVNLKIKKTSNP